MKYAIEVKSTYRPANTYPEGYAPRHEYWVRLTRTTDATEFRFETRELAQQCQRECWPLYYEKVSRVVEVYE